VIRCALIIGATVLAGAEACAGERIAALVREFQTVCATELPDFDRIEARAVAENLPVNLDMGTPRGEGFYNHIKSWIVTRESGLHELSAVEARGPAGEVSTCALTASDVSGDELKEELMRAFAIGPPGRENVTADGLRRSAWHVQVQSKRVILLMMDPTPVRRPGIYLNITYGPVARPAQEPAPGQER
jgi:hypothetical protein